MHEAALSDNWVLQSQEKNREMFSELDVLLRALDRFFIVDNLPGAKEHQGSRNFFHELGFARDVVFRIIGLLEVVIPESKRNVYWFQKFAAAKYMNDRRRNAFRRELLKQDLPEKSLLLLYDAFINVKGIITDILKTDSIPYLTFANLGQLVSNDIRENVHFNPFRKDLHPEFDVIENREISRLVKGMKDRQTKKAVSIILLSLFKFLRYLRHSEASAKFGALSSSVLIIILLKSELSLFRLYLDELAGSLENADLRALVQSIAYQFAMEGKRVFQQEIKEETLNRPSQSLEGKIENSHGILKNLTEQSIIQIVQHFKPAISGNEIFLSFVTKLEQSLRLREDVTVLHRMIVAFGAAKTKEEKHKVFEAMRNFMLYFQSFTFRLLRYDDYEEFSGFFDKVLVFTPDDVLGKNLPKLLDSIRHFTIFIETCVQQLANRAELMERPLDMRRVETSLHQYLR